MHNSLYTPDAAAFVTRQGAVAKFEDLCAFDDGAIQDAVEAWEVEEFNAGVYELECGRFAPGVGGDDFEDIDDTYSLRALVLWLNSFPISDAQV